MGKWINLEQRYSCDMKTFRDLFCLSTSFHETFHKIRKDEDVVVTDWMQTTNVTQQRLCFFNMYIDKFGLIKCVEKQNYEIEQEYRHVIEWSLTPDATFSGLFNVNGRCTLDEKSPYILLKLKIQVTAEGGGGWGLGSIVENTAAEVIKKYFESWIQLVFETLEKYNMAKFHENQHYHTKNVIESNNSIEDSLKSRSKRNIDGNLNENTLQIVHNNSWPINFDLQNSTYPPSLLPNVNKSRESVLKKNSASPRIALRTINYPYDIEGKKKFKPKDLQSRSQTITTVITIVSIVLISSVFIIVLLYYNQLYVEEEEDNLSTKE